MSLTSRRYLIVIINGTKNPHRSAVAKDITDAILKTHATDGKPATYWNKGEQESRLEAAYEKWLKHGKVWSVAASNVSQARTDEQHIVTHVHWNRLTMNSSRTSERVVSHARATILVLMGAVSRLRTRAGIPCRGPLHVGLC